MKGEVSVPGQFPVRMTKSDDIIIAGRDGTLLSIPGPLAYDSLLQSRQCSER